MKLFFSALIILLASSCALFIDIKEPPPHKCGDNIVDYDEECDGVDLNGQTCNTLGLGDGVLLCNDECTFNSVACDSSNESCGDGIVDTLEDCDGTNLDGETCYKLGFHDGELSCNSGCEFDFSNCTGGESCGNSLIEDPEECDNENLNSQTCTTLGYSGGELSCSISCSFDISGCTVCGDGVINGEEECDGDDLNGMTCSTLGLDDRYPLFCDDECNFAGCHTFPTVTTGYFHTCSVNTNGNAYCWGNNEHGQLGDAGPASQPSTTPVPVGGNKQYRTVQSNYSHNCAIDNSAFGNVFCWGANDYGQLGDNTTTDKSLPTQIDIQRYFKFIAVGSYHSCGVIYAGNAVYCWGNNNFGQLGNDSNTDSIIPVAVNSNHEFKFLTAGDGHTCGITTSDDTYCWGRNSSGELGIGTNISQLKPELVAASNITFTSLTAGYGYTCGLTTDGQIYCWGNNDHGQLGTGTSNSEDTPVHVFMQTSDIFQSISGGYNHTCAITSSHDAYCWGDNANGALGNGTTTDSLVPTLVSGGYMFYSISANYHHTCGVTMSGDILCWGRNDSGQLGNGTTTSTGTPVLVEMPW